MVPASTRSTRGAGASRCTVTRRTSVLRRAMHPIKSTLSMVKSDPRVYRVTLATIRAFQWETG